MRKILLALAALAAVLLLPGGAGAANGDNLRQIIADRGAGNDCASINAAGDHGRVGTGIAFNGTNLLLTCWSSNQVAEVSPADGSYVATHTIAGGSDFGAIAYDNGRGGAWVCQSFFEVGFIDFSTNTYTPAFPSQGCLDGLAYDGADDTIWSSYDVSATVQHYSTTGTLLSSNAVAFGPGNSGIAVGGPMLYLANNGGSQIYEVAKDFSTSTLFATFSRRLEDLECDNITFGSGPTPKAAIWSVDAYDNILNAWEIPDGACLFGGGVSELTLSPATATNNTGSPHTVTAHLEDRDGPVMGETILFTVTGANSASGSDVTDVAGDADFTYTGTNIGTDTITACADENANGACDPDEPTATAHKEWVNQPPTCTGTASGPSMWPPNHTMRSFSISGVTDPDGDAVSILITGVTQDEPVDAVGNGDGNTSPDAAITGANAVDLRAERAGTGDGRVYEISYTASDGNGGTCTGTATVGVPHDQGAGATPIDSGQLYDSLLP